MLKKKFALFFCLIGCLHLDAQEFVITKKKSPVGPKSSRTKLKEEIGGVARDAFHASRALIGATGKATLTVTEFAQKGLSTPGVFDLQLQKAIGTLQISLAAVQKKISTSLERLLDNKAPFKGASRVDLSSTHTVLYDVAVSLEQSKAKIKNLRLQLAQATRSLVFKKETTLEQQKLLLKKQHERKERLFVLLKKSLEEAALKAEPLVALLKNDTCLKQL